jgi:hypothetical protein
MALITENLEIPPVAGLFPSTRRWRESKLRPHGTAAAHRKHLRDKTPICAKCRRWNTLDIRLRRTQAQLAALEAQTGPPNSRLYHHRPEAAYQRMTDDEYAEAQYESLRAAEPF